MFSDKASRNVIATRKLRGIGGNSNQYSQKFHPFFFLFDAYFRIVWLIKVCSHYMQ
jgi:hypothetical protein